VEPDKICAALRRLAAKGVSGGEGPRGEALSSMDRRALVEAAELIEQAYSRSDSGAMQGLHLVMSIDGAARGNPGPAGIGVMIQAEHGPLKGEFRKYIGEATNNVAEYKALLLALEEASRLKPAAVKIRSDSELLVRQIEGRYRVKNPRLAVLHAQARDLIRTIPSVHFEHVGRDQNRQADALANRAIDEALGGAPRDRERA
jgi:ribonuclease HI